jgi:hypothetical protein
MDILTEYKGDDSAVTETETESETQTEEQKEETTQAKQTEKATQAETKAPLTSNVSQLINDVIDFQNDCSKRHELGEISDDDYVNIIQLGIEAAQIKEDMEKGGDTAELDKKAEDVRTRTYAMAQKVNSDYADRFK